MTDKRIELFLQDLFGRFYMQIQQIAKSLPNGNN